MQRVAINRRIRNLLNYYPAKDWTDEHAEMVLEVLTEIVKIRQATADVVVLRAPGTEPPSEFGDELVV